MFKERDDDRGQVGIGTLIVFIAMVLVAAIAAGGLINTAGFLQSKSEETGQQSGEQVTNRLQVLQASGETTSTSGGTTIGKVELITTKAPGAEDLDLEGVTMQMVTDAGTFDIIHDNVFSSSSNADGAFASQAIKDEDDSLTGTPVINSPDDRAKLIIDVGADDDLSVFKDPAGEDPSVRNSGLDEGESATLRITTASGTASTVRLTVPESLSGKTAASL